MEFKGYESNDEDADLAGNPVSIAGPFKWLIVVNKVDVRVDQSGSSYDFLCVLASDQGYADLYYKMPRNITSKGNTITQHVKEVEAQLNTYLKENSTSYTNPDEIVIDLGELVGSAGAAAGTGGAVEDLSIKDETVITSSDPAAEITNRPMESTFEPYIKPGVDVTTPVFGGPGSREALQAVQARINDARARDNAVSRAAERDFESGSVTGSVTGSVDVTPNFGQLDVKQGTSILDYIGTLLSMNKEFKQRISRKANIDDASSDEVNLDQTFVQWYNVKSKIEYLGWDDKRANYTKRFTYTPYIYKTARGDIVLTTNEYSYLKEQNKDNNEAVRISTKRLQDIVSLGNLRKAYYYIFTGKNDQILEFDFKIDGGHTLILPPRGGYTSDISITSAQNLAVQTPVNKDMTLQDVFSKAKTLADGRLFKDALKQLSETATNLAEFAAGIGRTPAELSAAINDSTGQAAQALVSALDSATLASAARSLDTAILSRDAADTPTENGSIISQGFGDYVPEISGQIYASDFITPNDSLKIEELESAGFIAEPKISSTSLSPIVNVDLPNKFNNATYDLSTPSNMLFGFVYRQHQNIQFLRTIDLTLRGDPWYLGANPQTGRADDFSRSNSNPEAAAFRASQNYFILQVGTHSVFDARADDEDANSGYWSPDISNSFSGVYYMMSVHNRFSGGRFTTQMNAVKEETIPLHLIRPLQPGETPPNFSDLELDRAVELGLGPARDLSVEEPGPGTAASAAARAALGISENPTPEELAQLKNITPVPPYDPNLSLRENALRIADWADANKLRIDENEFLADADRGAWNPDAHKGLGHAQDRAFDLNIGYGNVEASDPHLGMRLDYTASALRAAGYNVVWRTAGHFNHIHFEIPASKINPDPGA